MISVLIALLAFHGIQVSVDSASKRVPTIAVMPFEGKLLNPEEALVLGEALTTELQSKRTMRVVERSQVEKILSEQGFQKSGACDGSECAVEVGKLVGLDRMIVGSIGKLGQTWSMTVRMVDVQTGEILSSARDTREGKVEDLLRHSVPYLATQLTGAASPPKPVPDAAQPTLAASNEDRALRQEAQLSRMVDQKLFLEKKGLTRIQNLADSVPFQRKYAIYEKGKTSGWWSLANFYPIIPVGTIVQSDWPGLAMMGAGYIASAAMIERNPGAAGIGLFASYVFQLARPALVASSRNAKLSKALKLSLASSGDASDPIPNRVALELSF